VDNKIFLLSTNDVNNDVDCASNSLICAGIDIRDNGIDNVLLDVIRFVFAPYYIFLFFRFCIRLFKCNSVGCGNGSVNRMGVQLLLLLLFDIS
jgi:hypothetical protein